MQDSVPDLIFSDALVSAYQADIQSGRLQPDFAQLDAVKVLACLRRTILGRAGLSKYFFWRKTIAPQGVYLFGGVGRGKTYLMDLFFKTLPLPRKQRYHYYEFMRLVHDSLRQFQGRSDPLDLLAKSFSAQAKVICIDEFMVEDIADAMILGLLLKAILNRGIFVVVTSNVAPALLYLNGLQRTQFLPAIRLIQEEFAIVQVDRGIDYRTVSTPDITHDRFYQDEALIGQAFQYFSQQESHLPLSCKVNDRDMHFLGRTRSMAWIDFQELCEKPRNQSDYLELARHYQKIFISGVPVLTSELEGPARRFVSLIDVLYDQGLELWLSAPVSVDQLYQGALLAQVFRRTQSRLIEMLGLNTGEVASGLG